MKKEAIKTALAVFGILLLAGAAFATSPFTWPLTTPGDNDPVSVFPALFRNQIRQQLGVSGPNGGVLGTLSPVSTSTTGWRENQTTDDSFVCQNAYNSSSTQTPTWNKDNINVVAVCFTQETSGPFFRFLANIATSSNPISFTEWGRVDANGILLPNGKGINWETANNLTLGYNSVISTSTTGFPYFPSVCGPMTGVPTAITNFAPFVYDSCTQAIAIYNGSSWIVFQNSSSVLQTILSYINTVTASTVVSSTTVIDNSSLAGPFVTNITNSTGISLVATNVNGSVPVGTTFNSNFAVFWNKNSKYSASPVPASSWVATTPAPTGWGAVIWAWPDHGSAIKPVIIGAQSSGQNCTVAGGCSLVWNIYPTQSAGANTMLAVGACLGTASISSEVYSSNGMTAAVTNRLATAGSFTTLISADNNGLGATSTGSPVVFTLTTSSTGYTQCKFMLLYFGASAALQNPADLGGGSDIAFNEGTGNGSTVGPINSLNDCTGGSSTGCTAISVINNDLSGGSAHTLTTAASNAGWVEIGNQLAANQGGVSYQIDQCGYIATTTCQSSWQEASATTLVSGSAIVTLPHAYTTQVIAVCTDTTAANAVKCSATTTQILMSGTGTDVINWITVGW